MKKVIPVLISLILIVIIGFIYIYNLGYRVVVDTDGKRLGKKLNIESYVEDAITTNFLTIKDGDDEKKLSLKAAGISANVLEYKCSTFVDDRRYMKLKYFVSADSILYHLNDDRSEAVDGTLTFDEDGNAYLEGGNEGNIINIKSLVNDIVLKSDAGLYNINIDLEDYAEDGNESEYLENAKRTMDKLKDFKIEYDCGFTLTSNILAKRGLLKINDDGTFHVTMTEGDARDICGKNLVGYNTIGETFSFTNYDGKVINVKSETYGDYIDYKSEGEYLLSKVNNWESESNRKPIMKQEALYDIDETYVELDISKQHAYYYKDGKLVWDSDVVTGLPTKERATPKGIYFIINKTRNQRLEGETWDVKVDRWLGVTYTGVGFHDANWRKSFGGSIYKSNGSHGCINTPTEKMKELYDIIEVNTPVVIY